MEDYVVGLVSGTEGTLSGRRERSNSTYYDKGGTGRGGVVLKGANLWGPGSGKKTNVGRRKLEVESRKDLEKYQKK